MTEQDIQPYLGKEVDIVINDRGGFTGKLKFIGRNNENEAAYSHISAGGIIKLFASEVVFIKPSQGLLNPIFIIKLKEK